MGSNPSTTAGAGSGEMEGVAPGPAWAPEAVNKKAAAKAAKKANVPINMNKKKKRRKKKTPKQQVQYDQMKKRLIAFYKVNNPARVDEVDDILERYADNEYRLYMLLHQK